MAAQRRGAPPEPSPNPNPNSNPNPNPNPSPSPNPSPNSNPNPDPSPSANPNQVLFRASPPLENASWQRLGNPTRNGHTFYSQPTAVLPYPYYPATTPSYSHWPPRLQAGGDASSQPRLLLYLGDRWNMQGPGSVGDAC